MTKLPKTSGQRLSVVYAILILVLILVVMQLWLLTATMNAFLGGNHSIVWPAAVASTTCLCLSVGLLRYLVLLDW